MSESFEIDVMISLQCATMADSAQRLKNELVSMGLNVWICIEMLGGEDYRDSIVEAVKKCKIFVPLINEEWALSGECKDEYHLAKRLHLTSHERGFTTRDQPRRPSMVPIAFKGLRWNAHPHVELLGASVNFIVHNSENLMDGSFDNTVKKVAVSIFKLGVAFDIPPALIQTTTSPRKDVSTLRDSADESATIVSPSTKKLAMVESAFAILQDLQSLITSESDEHAFETKREAPTIKSVDESNRIPPTLEVGSKYIGISSSRGRTSDGHSYTSYESCEFTLLSCSENGENEMDVVFDIEQKCLNVLVDDSDKVERDPQLPYYLREFIRKENLSEFRAIGRGTYRPVVGLLLLDVPRWELQKGSGSVQNPVDYSLVVFDDNIAGTRFDHGDTRTKKEATEPVILRRM